MRVRIRHVVCALVAVGVGCAGTLQATLDDPLGEPFDPSEPATSAERALARAERAARHRAFLEQGPRDAEPLEDETASDDDEDEPEDDDAAPPEEESDAGVDAAPLDAAAPEPIDAAADAGDAAPAPVLDVASLCSQLCERTLECMREIVGDDLPPMILREMRERCEEQCHEQADKGGDDAERVKKVQECMAERDCEAFMNCVRSLAEAEDDD